jgi:hypothetical protein
VLSTHIQPAHGQSCEPLLLKNVQSIATCICHVSVVA